MIRAPGRVSMMGVVAASNHSLAPSVSLNVRTRLSAQRINRLKLAASRILTIGLVGAIGTISLTAPASSGAAAAIPAPRPNPADFSCSLPALPHGAATSPYGAKLSGPAVSTLTGGAAHGSFSVDGNDFAVNPPRRDDVPILSAHQALCGAMASTGDLGPSAAQGVAVGFGRVTIASKFFPAITGFLSSGDDAAKYPKVASFHNRLAWLVVVRTNPPSFSCPAESVPVRLIPRPSDHDYEVFTINARTGTDALVYRESAPGGCKMGARIPPTVGVAEESISVPWTLTSRDPRGYSGMIAATVQPCDVAPSTVLVDEGTPTVEVQVTRPFGPPCGQTETVPIDLHAATVTSDLPTDITHFPVGLLTGLSLHPNSPGGTSVSGTTTTLPALIPVDVSSSGQTLQVSVGQVLTVLPLPGWQGASSLTSPAVSSNSAVLGPLTSDPQLLVAEFRAWKKGSADITVPQSACIHPGSNQLPCSGPFVVHVVVN